MLVVPHVDVASRWPDLVNGQPGVADAVEEISRLMGHKGTAVTEFVYRHELRPVIESGASVMDSVFPLSVDENTEGGKDDDDAA